MGYRGKGEVFKYRRKKERKEGHMEGNLEAVLGRVHLVAQSI